MNMCDLSNNSFVTNSKRIQSFMIIQGQKNRVKSVQSKQNYIRFSKQINANTIVYANSKRNLLCQFKINEIVLN